MESPDGGWAVDRTTLMVFAVAAVLIAWACLNLVHSVAPAPQPW